MQDQGAGPTREHHMITGVHAIIYSEQADAVRAFFRDVLEYRSVDAGRGWLIFALPPAEIAVHPAEGDAKHELYLMCDDLDQTLADLRAKGVEPGGPIHDERWGRLTSIRIAEGTTIGIYQPKHPLAITL
jgi:predicted enzyme related to lactoylglutathione lyase